MARSPDWEKVPMAEGGEDPLWPMPDGEAEVRDV
jgi:hypothetical protein